MTAAVSMCGVRSWERVSAAGIEPNRHWPECADNPSAEQIAACRLWLRTFASPTKTIRRHRSSYGYKHEVERWTRTGERYEQVDPHGRTWTGDYLYIPNGAFITAAIAEGYRVERCAPAHLNCFFNLSTVHK